MSWKNRTYIVMALIVVMVVAVLIYDAVAIHYGGTEASISSIIITMSYKMPFANHILGVIEGILIGHLFWRMKGNKDTRALGLDDEQK